MKLIQRKRKKVLLWIALPVLLAVSLMFPTIARAIWNEDTAVHIKAGDVEDSTLAIGTHLVHLSALTDEIYEIAQQSAAESGQNSVYYKSELAGGAWFDITTAQSLTAISTQGTPVENSVIEALFFTHHTKSDGITYDLRTNNAVGIFDIKNPYDIETLDELMPLKTQYDLTREIQSDDDAAKQKLAQIENILKTTTVKNEITNQCDANLEALQAYYVILNENGGTEPQKGAVLSVMKAVDATRRAQVFVVLEPLLTQYAQQLQSGSDPAQSDTALQSAVNDSLSNVSASLIKQQGMMLAEGTTVMSEVRFMYSNQLIADAAAVNHTACDQDVAALISLSNILNSIVADKANELNLLESVLLPKAEERYTSGLKAGENAAYLEAVKANSAAVLLNKIAEENTGAINTSRVEFESYISGKCMRQENAAGSQYIQDRLNTAGGFYSLVKSGAFAQGANASVASHIEFLTRKLSELQAAGGRSSVDIILTEKAELMTQYLEKLDDNDLKGAQEIKEKISALDVKLESIQQEQANQISDARSKLNALNQQKEALGGKPDSALDSQISNLQVEIAAMEAALSDGSVVKQTISLKNECAKIINQGKPDAANRATLLGNIDALGNMLDLDYKTIFPVLQGLYDSMIGKRDVNGDQSFGDSIAAVEDFILNNRSAYDAAMRETLDVNGLKSVAEGFFSGKTSLLDGGTVTSLTGGGSTSSGGGGGNTSSGGGSGTTSSGGGSGTTSSGGGNTSSGGGNTSSGGGNTSSGGGNTSSGGGNTSSGGGNTSSGGGNTSSGGGNTSSGGGNTSSGGGNTSSGGGNTSSGGGNTSSGGGNTSSGGGNTSSGGGNTSSGGGNTSSGGGNTSSGGGNTSSGGGNTSSGGGNTSSGGGNTSSGGGNTSSGGGNTSSGGGNTSSGGGTTSSGGGTTSSGGGNTSSGGGNTSSGGGNTSSGGGNTSSGGGNTSSGGGNTSSGGGNTSSGGGNTSSSGGNTSSGGGNTSSGGGTTSSGGGTTSSGGGNTSSGGGTTSSGGGNTSSGGGNTSSGGGNTSSGGGATSSGGGANTAFTTNSAAELNEDQKAVVDLMALQMLSSQTGSDSAKERLSALAQQQIMRGNPMVFLRLKDAYETYIPVTSISGITGMRYVWNQNLNQATLAMGRNYYAFSVFSDKVMRSKTEDEAETMTQVARYQNVVYIPADYSYSALGVDAVLLNGTNYGIAYTDELKSYAEQLFSLYLQG